MYFVPIYHVCMRKNRRLLKVDSWCNKQSGRRYANYVIDIQYLILHSFVIVLDRYCFFTKQLLYYFVITRQSVIFFFCLPFYGSKAKLIKRNYQSRFIASERNEVGSYRVRIPWQYDALRHTLDIGLLSMFQPGLL